MAWGLQRSFLSGKDFLINRRKHQLVLFTLLRKKEQHLGGGLSTVLNFWEVQVKTGLEQTIA